MPIHHSFHGGERFRELPDIELLDGVVAERILDAMESASAQLTQIGVPYALIGALAVGAHGHPRATKDVDFLVGNEAFCLHAGGIVTIAPGVPIAVGGVAVDPVSIGADEGFLNEAIATAEWSGDIPIIPIDALIYLKLKSPRRKDAADIVELVKHANVPLDDVRGYLEQHAPDLILRFERLVADAEAEDQ